MLFSSRVVTARCGEGVSGLVGGGVEETKHVQDFLVDDAIDAVGRVGIREWLGQKGFRRRSLDRTPGLPFKGLGGWCCVLSRCEKRLRVWSID